MLLIITPTAHTWAWVIKRPDHDVAVAAGFGYATAAAARVVGSAIVDLLKEK